MSSAGQGEHRTKQVVPYLLEQVSEANLLPPIQCKRCCMLGAVSFSCCSTASHTFNTAKW
jgi:hypothetical protein